MADSMQDCEMRVLRSVNGSREGQVGVPRESVELSAHVGASLVPVGV